MAAGAGSRRRQVGTRGGAGVRAQLVVSPAGTGSDWGRHGRQESKRLSREHDCYRIERWDSWLMVPRQRPMARRKLDFEIKGISLFDVFSLMFDTLTHYKLLQRIYPD